MVVGKKLASGTNFLDDIQSQFIIVYRNTSLKPSQLVYDFIHDRAGRVALKGIDGPPSEWSSPLDAFESAYRHEQKVTGLIHDLVDTALAEKDRAAEVLLQWYVTEQVEEEDSALRIVEKLKMIKDSVNGLLMLDSILGERE